VRVRDRNGVRGFHLPSYEVDILYCQNLVTATKNSLVSRQTGLARSRFQMGCLHDRKVEDIVQLAIKPSSPAGRTKGRGNRNTRTLSTHYRKRILWFLSAIARIWTCDFPLSTNCGEYFFGYPISRKCPTLRKYVQCYGGHILATVGAPQVLNMLPDIKILISTTPTFRAH